MDQYFLPLCSLRSDICLVAISNGGALVRTTTKKTDSFLFVVRGSIFIYIVVGTREEFVSISQKTKLPSNFVFTGEKPYTEIPLWLSAADALLVLGTKHDTQSYYYTSPMKVFEYLAMRRPIIASKTPAIEDIVSDKEVIFYEPDNYIDLAEKITFSVSYHKSIDNKIIAAITRVKDFTWQKRAKDIIDFIGKNI